MKIEKYIFILLAVFMLTACHTTKKAVVKPTVIDTPIIMMASTTEIIKTLQQNQPKFKTANASKLAISAVLKGRNFDVSGICQIMNDSVIYLSIIPMFGYELFRLECTPNNFTLIDKFNKRYAQETYNYFKTNFGIDVNFNTIQSIISNQLLLAGKNNYQPQDFEWKENQPQTLTLLSHTQKITQETVINSTTLNRISTYILTSKEYNSVVTIDYSNFQTTGHILFPHQIKTNVEQNGIKKAMLDFGIQKIEFDKEITLKATNLSKYKRVDLNSIFQK